VKLEKVGDAFAITRTELETEAKVSGIDDATFQKYALDAKQSCPVQKKLWLPDQENIFLLTAPFIEPP
jgi:lipoyl-dependent peroxiredoxin